MEEVFITQQKQSCLLYAVQQHHIQEFVKLAFFLCRNLYSIRSNTNELNKLLSVKNDHGRHLEANLPAVARFL